MTITEQITVEQGEGAMLEEHETSFFKVLKVTPIADRKELVTIEIFELNDFANAMYRVGFSRGYNG